MLPTAEIVFLDEIFKSNSAILNSLLHVINERKFQNGPEVVPVPLISLYAASNEVPNDENLAAMFDRFLVRVLSDNLDSYHFHELMKKGVSLELRKMTGRGVDAQGRPTRAAPGDHRARPAPDPAELRQVHGVPRGVPDQVQGTRSSRSAARASRSPTAARSSCSSCSRRRAVFDGRTRVHDGDFFILRHIWNNLDQVELLEEIVNPVVDSLLPRASRRAPVHRPVGEPRRSAHRARPHPRAAHLGRRARRTSSCSASSRTSTRSRSRSPRCRAMPRRA